MDPRLAMIAALALTALPCFAAEFNHPPVLAEGDLSLRDPAMPFEALSLPDGSLVLAGNLRWANDLAVKSLLRLLPDGSLDTAFRPYLSSDAESLAHDGSYLYVSGYFAAVDGNPISGLARFSLADFSLDTSFHPLSQGTLVTAIAVRDGFLYELQGGSATPPSYVRKRALANPGVVLWERAIPFESFVDFMRLLPSGDVIVGTDIGTQPLYKLSGATGAIDASWNPPLSGAFQGGMDLEIASNGDVLLAGYGVDALARFSSTTNTRIVSWTFAFEPEATAQVLSIAPTSDNGALISGDFTAINGHPTPAGIARILADGSVDTGWGGLSPGGRGSIIHLWDATRFAVGTWNRTGGDRVVAGLSATGAAVAGFPNIAIDSTGFALGSVVEGSGILLHGAFDRAGGLARAGLLRIDAANALDPLYQPDTSTGMTAPQGVKGVALTDAGHYVINAGSAATSVQLHRRLAPSNGSLLGSPATIYPATTSLTSYAAPPRFDAAQSWLYVAGKWNAGGAVAARRFRPSDGLVDVSWTPDLPTAINTYASELSGTHYYVGGSFALPAPLSTGNLVRMPISGTGAVDASWLPNPNGAVRVLMIDAGANLLYVGGDFSTIAGSARNGLARFDLGTGALDASWAPLPAGTQNRVYGLERDAAGRLYVVGTLGSVGCFGRSLQAARISAAGLVDPGWAVSADSLIRTVRSAGTGKVLLAGSFSRIEDSDRGAVAVVGEGSDLIFADHMGDNTCAQ
ncbi:MAG: hypothetical protein IPG63_04050 [Xanthomonadales bacterium]|nr:hypothetical protein [Xanthomonadales bacterium]